MNIFFQTAKMKFVLVLALFLAFASIQGDVNFAYLNELIRGTFLSFKFLILSENELAHLFNI